MSTELGRAKDLVSRFRSELDAAAPGAETAAVCTSAMVADHSYRGMRPFYDLRGPASVAETVWSPLKRAMGVLQRRPDMFIASRNGLREDGGLWVVSMGNFLGDFTGAWLGIPPTGKTTWIPYATFDRVEDGRIKETVEFLDILAVATQAGVNPLVGHQSGAHMPAPGPKTHDGVVTVPQDEAETRRTYELTARMLVELAETYTSPPDHLERYWHSDMNWFGPTGIGASLGFAGYGRGHTGPFEEKLEVAGIHDWEIAVAEGKFSAMMWWPCLTMRNIGGYMGAPANEALADMRVVDLYRREGDRLAENWIFIDLLHFLAKQGVDLLADIGART